MSAQLDYHCVNNDWMDLRTTTELEMELFYTEEFMRMAKKELWGYVRQRGWSAEDCARVDEIKRYLYEAKSWIAQLREELGLSAEEGCDE